MVESNKIPSTHDHRHIAFDNDDTSSFVVIRDMFIEPPLVTIQMHYRDGRKDIEIRDIKLENLIFALNRIKECK